MQQPSPLGDDYESDDYVVPDAGPQLTPEQSAERSALEVFPGASAALGSDEWWEQTDEPQTETDEPSEPLQFGRRRPSGNAFAEHPDPADESDIELDPAPPFAQPDAFPTRLSAKPNSLPLQAPAEPNALAPAPAPTATDQVAPTARPLPLLSGRERRDAAGASQRAAIMAAAGVPLDDEGDSAPQTAAEAQLAVAMGGDPRAKAARPPSGRSRVRRISLSLLVIGMSVALLFGGAIASGQRAEVERVASSLAPDVLERWISDRVSSFSQTAPATEFLGAPSTNSNGQLLVGQIANTGGGGVPVRSTCVPEARTPRSIAEGARISVIAFGVGDCAGWSVVRAGAAVSWVESAYLEPIPTP